MILLPAIDLLDSQCVRLTEGDYNSVTQYDSDPVRVGREFESQGAEWLHVVDLDGAKAGKPCNGAVIEAILQSTKLKVQIGGGIRTLDSVRFWRETGAARVVMGTAIARDLALAEAVFAEAPGFVVAGIDTKNGMMATEGWTESGSETGLSLAQRFAKMGCQRTVFTDIAKDGRLAGPNLEETKKMVEESGLLVIGSGGVSNLDDLRHLQAIGCEGTIVGKALYEGRFTLAEALEVTKLQVS